MDKNKVWIIKNGKQWAASIEHFSSEGVKLDLGGGGSGKRIVLKRKPVPTQVAGKHHNGRTDWVVRAEFHHLRRLQQLHFRAELPANPITVKKQCFNSILHLPHQVLREQVQERNVYHHPHRLSLRGQSRPPTQGDQRHSVPRLDLHVQGHSHRI